MSLTFALQALLARHEQFLLEAEDERRRLSESVDRLEKDKKELEVSNALMIEENRHLLDSLEEMNSTISNGDAQIKSLMATLQSSKEENMRLSTLAARASDLEDQLTALEMEQFTLRQQITSKEEDERTAIQRWRSAERTITHLQDQVEKIEREAIEERARHGEVMIRLERRNAVERELENAAGRLKGAAAITSFGNERVGNGVVSHFVKDILQDNANLQMGIMELKEMLNGSNEEVQNLREQIVGHQVMTPTPEDQIATSCLAEELAEPPALEALPELHVHHHYHAPQKPRSVSVRRPRKKRIATSPGIQTPSTTLSGYSTPRRHSHSISRASNASSAAILSQTAVSIPPPYSDRSPMISPGGRSSFALSSVPSTPRSAFRMFDTIDSAIDSSRPTSPESAFSEAPDFTRVKQQRSLPSCEDTTMVRTGGQPSETTKSKASSLFASNELSHQDEDNDSFHDFSMIPEEQEGQTLNTTDYSTIERISYRPSLRRSTSHESILSTTDSPQVARNIVRPQRSQIFHASAIKPRTSIAPITTSETATAQRSVSSTDCDLSGAKGNTKIPLSEATRPNLTSEGASTSQRGIASRFNGWLVGKWGMTPTSTPSTNNLRAKAALGAQLEKGRAASAGGKPLANNSKKPITPRVEQNSHPAPPSPSSPPPRPRPQLAKFQHRTTGINQSGVIKGLMASMPKPSKVELEPKEVDLEGLRDSLGEG